MISIWSQAGEHELSMPLLSTSRNHPIYSITYIYIYIYREHIVIVQTFDPWPTFRSHHPTASAGKNQTYPEIVWSTPPFLVINLSTSSKSGRAFPSYHGLMNLFSDSKHSIKHFLVSPLRTRHRVQNTTVQLEELCDCRVRPVLFCAKRQLDINKGHMQESKKPPFRRHRRANCSPTPVGFLLWLNLSWHFCCGSCLWIPILVHRLETHGWLS